MVNKARSNQSPPIRVVNLPRPVFILALIILTANILMLFYGGWVTGVTTDDPTHLLRLQSYFHYGWYLPTWQLDGGIPKPGVLDVYVYGPVASIIGQWFATLLKVGGMTNVIPPSESYATIMASAGVYSARHLAIGVFGVLGLVAVAGIGRIIFQSWRWGLLSASFLSAIPLWTGYSMINIKDIPVASGFVLVTLGLIILIRVNSFTSMSPFLIVGFCTLIIGSIISVGTRLGMWVFVLVSVILAITFVFWINARNRGIKYALIINSIRSIFIFTSMSLSYIVLLMIYPKAFSMPLKAASQSVGASAHYAWDYWTLSNGIFHRQPPPLWYFPTWFGNQMPILILALALIGLAVSCNIIIKTFLFNKKRNNTDVFLPAVALFLIILQSLFGPIVAIVLRSNVYSGLRQFLFIFPYWSILTTVGFWWLIKSLNYLPKFRKESLFCIYTIAVAALAMPTFDQFRLFPYNYTYFNEIASLRPIDGNWATDYWQTSFREVMPKIRKGVVLCILPPFNQKENLFLPYPSIPFDFCGLPSIYPFWNNRDKVHQAGLYDEASFWFIKTNGNDRKVPANCELYDKVTRPLRNQSITMSYIYNCSSPVIEYKGGALSFLKKASGQYLFYGWSPPEEYGSWSIGPYSIIGLELPDRLRGLDLTLTLGGVRLVPKGDNRVMRIYANDILLGEHIFDSSLQVVPISLKLPSSVMMNSRDGRLFIKLENPDNVTVKSLGQGEDTRPLGFFLSSLEIDPFSGN